MLFIGTPIRDIKEYAIYDWLDNVKNINYPKYLYMVDNSDNPDFSKRIKKYCKKIDLTDFDLLFLGKMLGRENEYRLACSREAIRNKILNGNYNYWFSWECDIILPFNALNILISYMGKFDVVSHCYPSREEKDTEVGGIGCSMFKREILECFNFLEGGGYAMCDPLKPNCYHSGDSWLITRILRRGYKMVEFHNLLEMRHLN